MEFHPIPPDNIEADGSCAYRVALPVEWFPHLDEASPDVSLLEDHLVLGPSAGPGLAHAHARRWGKGVFTLIRRPERGDVLLVFSASDNSDPRENGRRYLVANQAIAFAHEWPRLATRSWLSHSRGSYFLRRGGTTTPPPLFANLGITDICNLRCSICGSQNMLQAVNRRHMDFRVFSMVAETLFPLLVTVEFNSRGEPLLHPRIADMLEVVNDHDIFFRLQTNGTQLDDRRLGLLSQMRGELSVSVDATGELFERARRGARWGTVDQGVRELLRRRDPDRLAVNVYPTLTAATIGGAPDLVRWAMQVGIDRIDFHLYDPIAGGTEQRPTPEDVEALARFVERTDPGHPIAIWVNYQPVKPGAPRPLQRPFQQRYANMPRPLGSQGSHVEHTCMAPWQQVDLDLDGGVSVCCMTQQHKLGNALTPEAFADCWFGQEYQAIRHSLRRPASTPALRGCRECIDGHGA